MLFRWCHCVRVLLKWTWFGKNAAEIWCKISDCNNLGESGASASVDGIYRVRGHLPVLPAYAVPLLHACWGFTHCAWYCVWHYHILCMQYTYVFREKPEETLLVSTEISRLPADGTLQHIQRTFSCMLAACILSQILHFFSIFASRVAYFGQSWIFAKYSIQQRHVLHNVLLRLYTCCSHSHSPGIP